MEPYFLFLLAHAVNLKEVGRIWKMLLFFVKFWDLDLAAVIHRPNGYFTYRTELKIKGGQVQPLCNVNSIMRNGTALK